MPDSLRPYGLQPTRLLCPWDSPGKNTGVGAIPFSRSSWLRDWIQVSHITGGFFTVWATRDSSAFSRMSQHWNHTVCGLFSLVSFTWSHVFTDPPHPFMAYSSLLLAWFASSSCVCDGATCDDNCHIHFTGLLEEKNELIYVEHLN